VHHGECSFTNAVNYFLLQKVRDCGSLLVPALRPQQEFTNPTPSLIIACIGQGHENAIATTVPELSGKILDTALRRADHMGNHEIAKRRCNRLKDPRLSFFHGITSVGGISRVESTSNVEVIPRGRLAIIYVVALPLALLRGIRAASPPATAEFYTGAGIWIWL